MSFHRRDLFAAPALLWAASAALNLWTGQTSDADGEISSELRDHACALFKLT